jgi:hypothetical protein
VKHILLNNFLFGFLAQKSQEFFGLLAFCIFISLLRSITSFPFRLRLPALPGFPP